jgi:hypothetical protein
LFLSFEGHGDNSFLQLRLKTLNDPHGPFTFALDGPELSGRDSASEQGLGQQVRCHHGILYRIVDPHAAHRRHDVRRVTDQQ